MEIKIPFTNKTLYLGKKAVENAKRSFGYGMYSSIYSNLSSQGRVSFKDLYQIFNDIVDVKQAVRKIQNAVMKEGYVFIDSKGEALDMSNPQVAKAEEILNPKNRDLTVLKDIWVRDLCVAGNAYWHIQQNIEGNTMEVVPVDPRSMIVVTNKYGDKLKYLQRVAGQEQQAFDEAEMVHAVMDHSTKNPVLGVSPIESIVWEAKTEMEAQKSNFYFYENHGIPAHLLMFDENLSAEQLREAQDELERKYKGAENRFKAGIIPHLKDVKTIAMSQKDMKYLETRAFTTRKIVIAFGVDSFILGYTDGVQRGNAEVIYKMFYENTVRPYETYLEKLINLEVLPELGLNNIKFKIKLSSYDNEKEISEITRADVIAGIMTINEARKKRGLDELDNELADEPLFQGILLDDLGQDMGQVKKIIEQRMTERNEQMYNLLEDDFKI